MKEAFKDKIYYWFILFCLFLVSIGIPYSKWLSINLANVLSASTKLVFIAISLLIIKKKKLAESYVMPKGYGYISCLPFFLICFTNLIFLAIKGEVNPIGIDTLWSYGLSSLASAIAEEILFRVTLISLIKEKTNKEWIIVLISSGVFALSHVVNFFVNAPLLVLAQIGYTFILGLFLSLSYLRGAGLLTVSLLHFLFNFLNMDLFVSLYQGDWDLLFYLINISIGALLVGYGALLLFKKKKAPMEPNSSIED